MRLLEIIAKQKNKCEHLEDSIAALGAKMLFPMLELECSVIGQQVWVAVSEYIPDNLYRLKPSQPLPEDDAGWCAAIFEFQTQQAKLAWKKAAVTRAVIAIEWRSKNHRGRKDLWQKATHPIFNSINDYRVAYAIKAAESAPEMEKELNKYYENILIAACSNLETYLKSKPIVYGSPQEPSSELQEKLAFVLNKLQIAEEEMQRQKTPWSA